MYSLYFKFPNLHILAVTEQHPKMVLRLPVFLQIHIFHYAMHFPDKIH